jgi:hypothetical protein
MPSTYVCVNVTLLIASASLTQRSIPYCWHNFHSQLSPLDILCSSHSNIATRRLVQLILKRRCPTVGAAHSQMSLSYSWRRLSLKGKYPTVGTVLLSNVVAPWLSLQYATVLNPQVATLNPQLYVAASMIHIIMSEAISSEGPCWCRW